MKIDVISLFPEMFASLDYGITGRAQKNGLLELGLWNPRDFTEDKHRTVDDKPYGGGPGMLMKVEPLQKAIQAAKNVAAPGDTKCRHVPVERSEHIEVIYFSPAGEVLTQEKIQELSTKKRLILIAGRYEGIDQRLIKQEVDEVYSIGDYVLSGGELAAMVMIDGLTRLIPGSLGHADSAADDSFSYGLLEYPQYTRPEKLDGLEVPQILLSGDHKAIARWRLKQSLGLTWQKRPDLLAKKMLTKEDQELLDEFINELQ